METKFAHRGQHIDGTWYHIFDTALEALEDLHKYAGAYDYENKCMTPFDPARYRLGVTYTDDIGGVHRVMEVDDKTEQELIDDEMEY